MSLKLKEKQIPILQEYILLVTEANLWEGIKNGNYSWVKIDTVRKEKLFKLITLYKEFSELVESVENLKKLKEEEEDN